MIMPNQHIPLAIDADGVIRVGKTRVTLDTVIQAFAEGATAEEIAQQYPAVALADIYVVLGYYLHNQREIDGYLVQRRQQAEAVRNQNEAPHDPAGIRQRLLARRINGKGWPQPVE